MVQKQKEYLEITEMATCAVDRTAFDLKARLVQIKDAINTPFVPYFFLAEARIEHLGFCLSVRGQNLPSVAL
jgi:hypothetical protein